MTNLVTIITRKNKGHLTIKVILDIATDKLEGTTKAYFFLILADGVRKRGRNSIRYKLVIHEDRTRTCGTFQVFASD